MATAPACAKEFTAMITVVGLRGDVEGVHRSLGVRSTVFDYTVVDS
jgi:hypothetical protein